MRQIVRYRLEEAEFGSAHLERLLSEGWEPFAVVVPGKAILVYLRRLEG